VTVGFLLCARPSSLLGLQARDLSLSLPRWQCIFAFSRATAPASVPLGLFPSHSPSTSAGFAASRCRFIPDDLRFAARAYSVLPGCRLASHVRHLGIRHLPRFTGYGLFRSVSPQRGHYRRIGARDSTRSHHGHIWPHSRVHGASALPGSPGPAVFCGGPFLRPLPVLSSRRVSFSAASHCGPLPLVAACGILVASSAYANVSRYAL
jgi:hypothetical protein